MREHLEPLEGADVIVGWTVQELGVFTAAAMQMLAAHTWRRRLSRSLCRGFFCRKLQLLVCV